MKPRSKIPGLTGLLIALMLLTACGGTPAADLPEGGNVAAAAEIQQEPEFQQDSAAAKVASAPQDAESPQTEEDAPPEEASGEGEQGESEPALDGTCPLTGLPTDSSLLDNRPIFISISQFPAWASRPPTGLNAAPVVFETLLNEGQTRLQALFYCGYPEKPAEKDEEAGFSVYEISGVRSGRIFYSELAKLFNAGLIFGGASPEVYPEIAPFQCASIQNAETPPNTGAGGLNIETLAQVAESCKHRLGNTDLGVWQFGAPPQGGEPVENFLMVYNYLNQTRWEYDPADGGYVRYQNDPETPLDFYLSTDRLTGEPIVRQNIILLETPHRVLNSTGTIIDFDLANSGGYAWLLRDGAIHQVCWSAVFKDYPTPSNRYRPFVLLDCDTREIIHMATGSTWINVVDPSVWFEWDGDTYVAKQPFLGYGP